MSALPQYSQPRSQPRPQPPQQQLQQLQQPQQPQQQQLQQLQQHRQVQQRRPSEAERRVEMCPEELSALRESEIEEALNAGWQAADGGCNKGPRRLCAQVLRTLWTFVRHVLCYPMFIVLGTSGRSWTRTMLTPWRTFGLNVLFYLGPFLAITSTNFAPWVEERGRSANVFVGCFLVMYLLPVLVSLALKIRGSRMTSQIPTGTFCFRPAYRFRHTGVNYLALAGVLFEFTQMAVFLLPPPLLSGAGPSTARQLRKYLENLGLDLYTSLFWACIAMVAAQQAIVLLRVVLADRPGGFRLANSRRAWMLVSVVSGPLYIVIVVALVQALDCDYEASPAVLFADSSVVCWKQWRAGAGESWHRNHWHMVTFALSALGVYLPQATLMPTGTYKETMKNEKLDVLFVPLYLQAHFVLKGLFSAVYAIMAAQLLQRAMLLLLISVALVTVNEIYAPCSLHAINVLRGTMLTCCLWVGCVSLVLVHQNPEAGSVAAAAEQMREDAAHWGLPMILTGWLLLLGNRLLVSDTLQRLRHSATYNVMKAMTDLDLNRIEDTRVHPRCLEALVALSHSDDVEDVTTAIHFVPALAKLLSHESSRVQFQACWCLTNLSCLADAALEKSASSKKHLQAPAAGGIKEAAAVAAMSHGGAGGARRPAAPPRPPPNLLSLATHLFPAAAMSPLTSLTGPNEKRRSHAASELNLKTLNRAVSHQAIAFSRSKGLQLGGLPSQAGGGGGAAAGSSSASSEGREHVIPSFRISSTARREIVHGGTVLPRLFALASGTETLGSGASRPVPGLLKMQAFATLINMAAEKHVAEAMAVHHDAAQIFITVLRTDPFMGQFAALGLANLAQTEGNRALIRASGGLSPLITSVMSRDVLRTKHACLALANMSLSAARHQSIFVAAGVLQRLVKLTFTATAVVRDHASVLLCYLALSGNDHLLRMMLRQGVLAALQRMRGELGRSRARSATLGGDKLARSAEASEEAARCAVAGGAASPPAVAVANPKRRSRVGGGSQTAVRTFYDGAPHWSHGGTPAKSGGSIYRKRKAAAASRQTSRGDCSHRHTQHQSGDHGCLVEVQGALGDAAVAKLAEALAEHDASMYAGGGSGGDARSRSSLTSSLDGVTMVVETHEGGEEGGQQGASSARAGAERPAHALGGSAAAAASAARVLPSAPGGGGCRPRMLPLQGIITWDSWPSSMDSFAWMQTQRRAAEAFVITEVGAPVAIDVASLLPGKLRSKLAGAAFAVASPPQHGTLSCTATSESALCEFVYAPGEAFEGEDHVVFKSLPLRTGRTGSLATTLTRSLARLLGGWRRRDDADRDTELVAVRITVYRSNLDDWSCHSHRRSFRSGGHSGGSRRGSSFGDSIVASVHSVGEKLQSARILARNLTTSSLRHLVGSGGSPLAAADGHKRDHPDRVKGERYVGACDFCQSGLRHNNTS